MAGVTTAGLLVQPGHELRLVAHPNRRDGSLTPRQQGARAFRSYQAGAAMPVPLMRLTPAGNLPTNRLQNP